jgi:nicotinamide-nucleotide amidase
LVAVGRELLRGQVAEVNTHRIAAYLAERGALVRRITVIDDDVGAVAEAVRESLDRNPHLVITCGGLGPAPDDVTLEGVARALGVPLSMSHQARSMVERAYQRLSKSRQIRSGGLNLAREKMCRIPVGSRPVENERGIPPGVICRLPGGCAVICLPGTPDEACSVLESAFPGLQELAPRSHTERREVEAPSADESGLRDLLERLSREYPRIWISSRPVLSDDGKTRVLVTLEATAPTRNEANVELGGALRRLLAMAGGSR